MEEGKGGYDVVRGGCGVVRKVGWSVGGKGCVR